MNFAIVAGKVVEIVSDVRHKAVLKTVISRDVETLEAHLLGQKLDIVEEIVVTI